MPPWAASPEGRYLAARDGYGTRALERRIGDKIGLSIDIKHKGDGGEVRLKYANLEQLDRLVAMLGA